MGKKNKSKKNKNKKKPNSLSQKVENNDNIDNNIDETEEKNEPKPPENKPPKKKISKEILHKKKELRRKVKKLGKKNKKQKNLGLQYFEEIEDFFMNPEDLEKMPHDKFTPYKIPTTIEENEEYIPLLIAESDIILELLDARDIYHSKNASIERLINNYDKKVLILVITKSDLVTEEYINKIKKDLEKENNKNHIIITSSLMREKIQSLFEELQTQIKLYKEKNDKNPVKIGIIGAPNVGKNSLIQSLELIVNTNCEEKYIYFDEEKKFCVNSVPGITFDEDENNNFLISKKYKEIKNIPEPMKLIKNLMNIVDKNKLKEIYEFGKIPENLDEFIDLLKKKYEFEDKKLAVLKILNDIITGKISYEVSK